MYKTGDKRTSGERISAILGDSHSASVFTTEDGQLRWEYHPNGGTPPTDCLQAIGTFNRLMTDVKLHLPKPRRPDVYAQLGKALHSALDGADVNNAFHAVKERITNLSLQHARLRYVLSFLIVFVSICVILGLAIQVMSGTAELLIVAGGIAGAIGACISVLQRSNRIPLDPYSESIVLIMLGGSRALVGAIFGSFFVMAATANLVLGVVND